MPTKKKHPIPLKVRSVTNPKDVHACTDVVVDVYATACGRYLSIDKYKPTRGRLLHMNDVPCKGCKANHRHWWQLHGQIAAGLGRR